MNTRRKTLSTITADVGPVPEIPMRAETEAPVDPLPAGKRISDPAPPPRRRVPRQATAAEPRAQQAPAARPSARDLAAPAKQAVLREALKVDVPGELALLRRLRSYRLDKGMDIRDQVAIAVDEWLTREGY
jgi:hypothetical protein